MSLDTDVLIIGAGMSGIGLAVQLIRKFNCRSFQIVEKEGDVGGTWLVNTYPGCGCDVASHFYSYSFALNPNWSQKFSLRSEIQQYFRNVTEQYNLFPHIHFRTTVERAQWDENAQHWEVTLKNQLTKEIRVTRCRILVSGVGSLSIPRKCELPGADTFNGPLFHSAQWDPNFDWTGKNIVVIGNGCSATQFVPIMAETAGQLTQFARQSHYLAERPNPVYSPTFQVCMKYIPLAMRLYRLFLYAEMEKDFAGFDMQGGASIRRSLADENARYVRRMAPEKYHDVLIPHHEIGCKRKVMDTDYLVTLHRPNVELIAKDPVLTIDPTGVRTHNGRHVPADAIVLATGFQVFRMLFPMEIIGVDGRALQDYWDDECGGAAQAYFGTSVPGFPNFFVLMGPNTVTGHLSVIYTVECQIGYILRLIEPILRSRQDVVTSVDVKKSAAVEDSRWTQDRLKKMVWASGCTSWALDPKTGLNIAMYPQYQFMYWLRSVFIPSRDFEYQVLKKKQEILVGGWRTVRRIFSTAVVVSLIATTWRVNGIREVFRKTLQESRALLNM